jgi:hypothetical protein
VLTLTAERSSSAPAAPSAPGSSSPGPAPDLGLTTPADAGDISQQIAQLASASAGTAEADEPVSDNAPPCAGGQSFTAATQVLLASGKTLPISKLQPGDKVLAVHTASGKNQPETVTAVLVHHDTDRYDLTVKTRTGTQVIHPDCSVNFRSPNPDYPPNDAVMQAMQRQPINDSCVDCSEIADNLLKAPGGEGRIVSFKGPGDTLLVREGNSTVEYAYHQVYTDGRYAYDPRLSSNAIPWGD